MSREQLRAWLRLDPATSKVEVTTRAAFDEPSYVRERVVYASREGDPIPAFLLMPRARSGRAPAIVIHHQHNSERHLGKSEVCGLAGNPLQAFGVALVERGFVVLAPDSICFEERRCAGSGTEPHADDWRQHYDEMSHRLVRGDLLMRKVLDDAELGVSFLATLEEVDPLRIGLLGHSYGGNTTLFQAALDERVSFACASGAACSFRAKLEHRTGIEMAEVLPGLVGRFDVEDLLRLTAPRRMLVVSAKSDPYSRDAADLVARARPAFAATGDADRLEHQHDDGAHEMTRERADALLSWIERAAT